MYSESHTYAVTKKMQSYWTLTLAVYIITTEIEEGLTKFVKYSSQYNNEKILKA
jgi:hypothetical protein